jgi:hypothetical protein
MKQKKINEQSFQLARTAASPVAKEGQNKGATTMTAQTK